MLRLRLYYSAGNYADSSSLCVLRRRSDGLERLRTYGIAVLNVNVDIGSLEAAIALEDRNQILCTQTADTREGMAAFMQRRAPEFRDA